MTIKAAGKFQSYLKEQQSFSKGRTINTFMKVSSTLRTGSWMNLQLSLWERTQQNYTRKIYTQKGGYFKCLSDKKAPVLLEWAERWDCSLYKILKKLYKLDLINSAVEWLLSHHWLLISPILCDWHSLFWNIVELYSPSILRQWELKCSFLDPHLRFYTWSCCIRAGFTTLLRETVFLTSQSNRHYVFINYKGPK